ncbi:aspartate aminotransferase family protein [candidate division KSB1 bacterium]|nr:MAG: aspartate aminotransferase family protein [candidate division KSB1 bacterium]
MNIDEFRENAHFLVEWMVEYLKNIETYPVKSPVKPKEIIEQLPDAPPEDGESFDIIFSDFCKIILPGITHWQHPSFFAYFPANNSFPSILGEMAMATIGAQCMIWETSPSAAELEERVMQWTARMIGLPDCFTGVIQDTASTSTLVSILTAREKFSGYEINSKGFTRNKKFTVYCSKETHSSIEKAVKIAGIGRENLRKIDVDEKFSLIPEFLEDSIRKDIQNGYIPLCTIATIGTTGSTAIDPLKPIGEVCKRYNLWLHVDAALAGTALVLPEKRWMIEGIENVDTFVFNPHKWMFTNFDCSAYFVKDKEALIKTFEIHPEYLKTQEDKKVNNYRDWGIQLGRRFRALKLWFVIRNFGVNGIREKIRSHIQMAKELASMIENSPDFELIAPVPLNTVCFRWKPENINNLDYLNRLNEQLLENLNKSGKLYLTHTKLNGIYTIRFVVGQTNVQKKHVEQAWEFIVDVSKDMRKKFLKGRSSL